MRKKRFPFTKEFYDSHKFCCPFFDEFCQYKIPDCKTATALTIYFQIFYRENNTNQRLLNFAAMLYHFRKREFGEGNYFELLMKKLKPLTPQNVKLSPEFYAEAKQLLLASHEWDWVVPHLRKTYPSLIFGELK